MLKVDINELLAGEKFLSQDLSPEEHAKKSESNIVDLVSKLNEIDKTSRSKSIGTIVSSSLTGLTILHLFASSLREGKITDIIDFPTLLYLLGLKFAILSISYWIHDYLNAWKLCLPRNRLSEKEMKLAILRLTEVWIEIDLTYGKADSSLFVFFQYPLHICY